MKEPLDFLKVFLYLNVKGPRLFIIERMKVIQNTTLNSIDLKYNNYFFWLFYVGLWNS